MAWRSRCARDCQTTRRWSAPTARWLAIRPTAVNLRHALDDVRAVVAPLPRRTRAAAAWARAGEICDEDVALYRRIGEAGLPLIEAIHRALGRPVNILTHCNAGWLATVDWGTATAPIYMAHDRGVPRTRVRRRDAAAQPGRGADRLRARPARRAAYDHRRQRRRPSDAARASRPRASSAPTASPRAATPPTRSAPISRRSRRAPTACRSMSPLPHTTIDWTIERRPREIEIEERDRGRRSRISRAPRRRRDRARRDRRRPAARALNPAFDVTPAELIDGADHRPRRLRGDERGTGGAVSGASINLANRTGRWASA